MTFIASALCAAITAPLVACVARRTGIVDRPDGHRKLHASSVPLVGGPTVLVSVIVALIVAVTFVRDSFSLTGGDLKFLLSLAGASLLIVSVGILDDRFGLRGRQKLAGQFLAALIMLPSGIVIQRISIFGHVVQFGDLAPFITIFWILGAINALNLIDGVDGLASTTGIVLSLSIAAVTAILGGRPDGMLISIALAGALSGFLVYNFPPARMFLGDSGSMLIGLVLGCVALKCSVKQYTAVALIMPTAIWAIPIFDVAMAIVRRRLTGRSIYTTDRGHLHHCLVRRGHTGGRLLLIVGSLCGLTGLGAIAAATFESEILAIIAVVTALALLIVTRSFGHAELNLLTNRVRRFAGSLIPKKREDHPVLHDEQVRLHGQLKWEHLWEMLTEFAQIHDLFGVDLMVNLPSAGEEYHATWRARTKLEPHEIWRTEIPLVSDGLRAGYVRLISRACDGAFSERMVELAGGLKDFESEFHGIIRHLMADQQRPKVTSDVTEPAVRFSIPVVPEQVSGS